MAESRFDRALKRAFVRWNAAERQKEQTEEIPEMSAAFLERMQSVVRDETKIIREDRKMKGRKTWKKWWTAAICAAVVLAGTGCVYAVSPTVRAYINMLFLQEESSGRMTEVPEGWTGVYTAEDLEKIREDLGGNYILMNDIEIPDVYYEEGGIYEDGFVPIGGEVREEPVLGKNGEPKKAEDGSLILNQVMYPFTGTFNGNGYVISNVHVKQFSGGKEAPAGHMAGLFGKCKITAGEPVWDEATQEHYRDYTGGIIKNLGVTDSSVEITITGDTQIYGSSYINIGMIAGECDVVAGCFTENVEVTVVLDETISGTHGENIPTVFSQIKIGGVAGKTIITDSCWSDAKITLTNNSAAEIENPYVAGVVGFTNSCVTSYFTGEIQSVTEDHGTAGFDMTTPPTLLNHAVMDEIKGRLTALNDEWNLMKLSSFYTYCRADAMQMYITEDLGETGRYFYLLDPETKERERKELSRILSTIFTGDEFMQICQDNDVKYGSYNNYDLRQGSSDFDGFDFDYIWTMDKDGLPKLRLFTWSKETGITAYENGLQGVIRN